MRRGFTIIEILVTTGLTTIILSALWAMFSLGDRSRGVTATARALQTATLIQERMTNDLARIISRGAPFTFEPEGEKGRKLGFYVVDPEHAPPSGEVGVRAVLYRLPGDKQLLEREYNGRVEKLGSSPLVDAQFRPFLATNGPMVRVKLIVGRTKDDPAGPDFVHTFLVRPELRGGDKLPLKPLSDFLEKPEAKEGSQDLPVPAGMFKETK
jgi:type II secretory pathway pseudopilin PulG